MSFFLRLTQGSLRLKFVLIISLFIFVSGSLLSYYLISKQIRAAEQSLINKGSALIKVLASNCEYGVVIENEYVLDELISATAQSEDIIYIQVQNLKGEVLAFRSQDGVEIPGRLPAGHKVDSLIQRKIYLPDRKQELYDLSYPVVTSKSMVSRENLGSVGRQHGHIVTEAIGSVRVGVSIANTMDEVRRNVLGAVIIIMLVMAITILLTYSFVKIVVKPIESLAEASNRIAQGDLTVDLDISGKDEISQLALAFSSMVSSLKESRREIENYNRTLEAKIIERTRELEEAQSQLIQSEKMAAVGQLSAGVAHELNNPLGGILGYAQYTLEKMNRKVFAELNEKDFESYKKYLRDIETQTRRCKAIVQNLLKFSRSSAKIDMTDIDINEALLETISLIEHQMSMHKVKLTTDLQENIPTARANSGMLQQVFTNIIINALHAMSDGGNLIVSTRHSGELGEFAGVVEISITDSGCGIPSEIQKNIFEPFFTTKPVGKGTGLGLSVSYGIIKEHGGEIKVESVEDCGTTFTIILPLEKSEVGADTTSEPSKDTAGDRT